MLVLTKLDADISGRCALLVIDCRFLATHPLRYVRGPEPC